jgi:hypothetical protein
LLLKRDSDSYEQCGSKFYFAWGHCQVRHCLDFYSTFHFWYPDCEKIIADWEYYLISHHDHTPEPYRHHYWEIPLDEDDELNRRAHPNHSLDAIVRRGDTPPPDALSKPWPPKPNRPNQPNRPKGPPPNSPERFVGNHDPVAVESTEVSSSEDRSQGTTDSAIELLRDSSSSNPTSSRPTCPADKPNGNFCWGITNTYIIRCHHGIPNVGHCDVEMNGHPSSLYSPCWETSPTSGDAACSKK